MGFLGIISRGALLAASALTAIVGTLQPVAQAPLTTSVAPLAAGTSSDALAQTAIIAAIAHELTAATATSTTIRRSFGRLPSVAIRKGAAVAAHPAAAAKTAAPAAAIAPAFFSSATGILANTEAVLEPRPGGVFGALFNLTAHGKTVFSWRYGDQTIGGGTLPQFAASYSCNPPGDAGFAIRTAYQCTVSLTPLSGNDRRTQSRSFSFTTGPGALTASVPSSVSTHLVNDENNGGFSFANSDTKPIRILSETFDISYTGLGTMYGPLVLRLIDPTDPSHYIDYHMEKFAADPARPSTNSAAGFTTSWPFTIGASNSKMLPLEVLGVHKLSLSGTDPAITITLRSVTTDRNDITLRVNAPTITWTCKVVIGIYDPNATSGPFASGEACTR